MRTVHRLKLSQGFFLAQNRILQPMKPTLILFLLGALLCPLTLKAQQPPGMDKIRKREIAEVRFEGDSNISDIELASIIATHPSDVAGRLINSIVSSFGTPRQFIDEATLDEDTIRIFVYYRNRGFFDAKVRYELHESKKSVLAWQKINDQNKFLPPSKWEAYPLIEDTVIFHIQEGKSYTVAGFTFEGFERLPMDLQSAVTKNIGIKPKSKFSKEALDQEIVRIRETLGESGYPFLSLPYGYTVVERDTGLKTVTISLKFKPGPRIKIGETKIIYDTTYSKSGQVREAVVLRQLSLETGNWYKNSDRVASERDVQRLLTFQSVSIELDTSAFTGLSDSAKNGMTLPVIVFLRMRPTWEFTPGPFAGSSALGEFIFGVGASYSNRNLFDGAENLNLQGSYQFFPLSQKRASLSGQLIFPYFLFKNVPLILTPNLSYSSETGKYLEEIASGSAGSNFEISNDPAQRINLSPKLSLQYVVRDYIDPKLKPIGEAAFTLPNQFNMIISNDLVFDWRNDIQNPSHGSTVLHTIEWALPYISSTSLPSAAYLKNILQFKTFVNLTSTQERSVLAYRIMGGLVMLTHPNDITRDILFENKFYGGGTSSMRGWAARSLLVSNNTNPGWPSFGGYKIFETNLEWRYTPFHYPVAITGMQQILSPVRFALFCDVGNVYDKDVPISPKNFAITLGTGFRYVTLLGAIRLDFGFKFYDPYPDPYQPGTDGAKKNRDIVLAIPPNATTGAWIFNRKSATKLGDIMNIELALGQAF